MFGFQIGLHRLVVRIDLQPEIRVFDAVIVTVKHLCVGQVRQGILVSTVDLARSYEERVRLLEVVKIKNNFKMQRALKKAMGAVDNCIQLWQLVNVPLVVIRRLLQDQIQAAVSDFEENQAVVQLVK